MHPHLISRRFIQYYQIQLLDLPQKSTTTLLLIRILPAVVAPDAGYCRWLNRPLLDGAGIMSVEGPARVLVPT